MRSICAVLLFVLVSAAQCQNTAEEWFNKGLALADQGKYDEAIKCYDEAIRLDITHAQAMAREDVYQRGKMLIRDDPLAGCCRVEVDHVDDAREPRVLARDRSHRVCQVLAQAG
ncbi:MAG: tetratricopeptide repeat protein [Methanothrix sp.]|nr:tetratricopeptide repeat protein [Methanothrix sp.]MCX8207951.1 tetratricopeptide repeat protein [Methanothrix sp.]